MNATMTPHRHVPNSAKSLVRVAAALGLLILGGCQTLNEAGDIPDVGGTLRPGVPSDSRALAVKGAAALREGRLKDASDYVNAALKINVQSSPLQFMNGFIYHLRALQSDQTLFTMAEQGYTLAIQFDPTNWLARFQLGLLHLDRKHYGRAKAAFADALLFKDNDPELLYYAAVASYYDRDPETAAGLLRRLSEIEPDSPRLLRSSAMVLAAVGSDAEAKAYLDQYTKLGKPIQAAFLRGRVRDWNRFHARTQRVVLRIPRPGTGARPEAIMPAQDGGSPPSIFPDAAPAPSGEVTEVPAGDGAGASADAAKAARANEMVIVDVVIISSVEDISTARGINLLSGLTLQFGSSSAPAYGRAYNKVIDSGGGATSAETTTITRALTIPAITYSLNIANAGATRNEILARPTLVALNGKTSEFFSGENIKAASVSTTASSGSTEVEKDIGVKLGITPSIMDGNKIGLIVRAERTFLQTPSQSVQFTFQLRTSKTTVNANVVMEEGETLILSGLSEKETENGRNSVPLLGEIPIIQYLFSRQTTRDYNKSVLVLITPRRPEFVYRPSLGGKKGAAGEPVSELRARYTDWFKPYPNWASVFHHLQANVLYREFRTGDVALERWDTQSTRISRVKSALNFLYY